MVQGIVKLCRSFNFCGSFLCRMALHSSVRFTISYYPRHLFLDKMSFTSLTYFGIFSSALTKGMLICIFLKMSRNFVNWHPSFSSGTSVGRARQAYAKKSQELVLLHVLSQEIVHSILQSLCQCFHVQLALRFLIHA